MSQTPLLHVSDFALSFDNAGGPRIQAVDGAELSVFQHQLHAVVGESGCGKSVTAMSVLGLLPSPPARVDRGSMVFDSLEGPIDLLEISAPRRREIRGGEIAMIFQEPMTSLNPVYSIGDQLVEAIRLHRRVSGSGAMDIAAAALGEVGIPDPAARLKAYPHQFSGGMRQRVMIAMALACEPRLLLADEPTTALDVTIQKQILDLLGTLKQERGLGIVLITHDLGVVAQHADVVSVMYAGRVVECARVHELYERPLHPYTRGLLACIPKLDESQEAGQTLTTVREVVDDAAQFEGFASRVGTGEVPAGAVPWWPWRDAPSESEGVGLVEVDSDHFVALWNTPDVRDWAQGSRSRTPAFPAETVSS